MTYDAGWVAVANGRPAPVTRDGIGLITVHPACDGPCEIELTFDGGAQRKICLALSVLVMLGVAAAAVGQALSPANPRQSEPGPEGTP